jgi:hypothetical protein
MIIFIIRERNNNYGVLLIWVKLLVGEDYRAGVEWVGIEKYKKSCRKEIKGLKFRVYIYIP